MQSVVAIIATAAVLSAVGGTLPKDIDDQIQSAFCKVTACASPGTAMPKKLYNDGLAKCMKLKTGCFDLFSKCVEGIVKIIGLKPKTAENKDGTYDMDDASDEFLAKVKKAMISYAAHHKIDKSATQTYLLVVPSYSPVWLSSWFVCND